MDVDEVRKVLLAGLRHNGEALPLPPVPRPPPPSGGGGRSRQRFRRALAVWSVAERARAALYVTCGALVPVQGDDEGSPAQRVRVCHSNGAVDAHRSAWLHLLREGSRLERARRDSLAASPTGASLYLHFFAKRDGASEYGLWRRAPQYAPFEASLIAEPPLGHKPVPMLSALPPEVAQRYLDARSYSLMRRWLALVTA